MFLDDDGDIPNTDDGHSECYADFKEWATESPSHCLIPGVPVAILLAVAQSIRSTFLPPPPTREWKGPSCVLLVMPRMCLDDVAFVWTNTGVLLLTCVCVCVCILCCPFSTLNMFCVGASRIHICFSSLHTSAAVPSQAQFRLQLVGEQT